jgi:hypothetical protein
MVSPTTIRAAGETEVNANEYQCAACGEVFPKGWSDEEAIAELGEDWPGVGVADCDIICDDCDKKFMNWYERQPVSEQREGKK